MHVMQFPFVSPVNRLAVDMDIYG